MNGLSTSIPVYDPATAEQIAEVARRASGASTPEEHDHEKRF